MSLTNEVTVKIKWDEANKVLSKVQWYKNVPELAIISLLLLEIFLYDTLQISANLDKHNRMVGSFWFLLQYSLP